MSKGSNDRQPTGIYGFSNEEIVIYVDCNDDDPLPSILFSQFFGGKDWISNPKILQKGKNVLKIDEFDIKKIEIKVKPGGPIYIENLYTKEEQSQNIKIYIEGGILFPLFRINDNEDNFKKILNNYIQLYNKDVNTYYNIVELYGNRILITNNATIAYDLYNIQKESPQKNLENLDKIIKSYLSFDGIQFDKNKPYYDIKNNYINFHVRYTKRIEKGMAGYCTSEHVGVCEPNVINYTLISYKLSDKTVAHEIGQAIDIKKREIPEFTNLIFEEYCSQHIYKGSFNTERYLVIYDDIAPDNIDNLSRRCFGRPICKGFFLNCGDYAYSHFVWWDIESFYPGFFGKLDNFYRYNNSLGFRMTKNEEMVFYSNLILGFDAGYYFERFGLAIDKITPFNNSDTSYFYNNKMEEMKKLGKIKTGIYKKMWYADNDQYNFTLNNGKVPNINYDIIKDVKITKDAKSGLYNISLPVINNVGHLGFEIIENGKVIKFTKKLYYIDNIRYPNGYNPKYEVYSYDRLLNSKCIYPKATKSFRPKIKKEKVHKNFLEFK